MVRMGLFNSKKGMVDVALVVWQQWPEVGFLILLIIGIVIALAIQNAYLGYAVVFCTGLMSGRLIYKKTGKQPLFPFFLIVLGFLLGYVIGSVHFSRKIVALLFVLGAVIGYYMHKKGYVR